MRIARVFPRRNNATPTDPLAFYSVPGMFPPEVDEVHVSVTFTYDIPYAEYLAGQWKGVAPVKIGGVALKDPGGEFVPGRYLKPRYTITSRGCPNNCWFCGAWKNEGRKIRELKINPGSNLLDNNILACSEPHIRAVFAMLEKQPGVEFTGGLEAARLKPWHVDEFLKIKPKQMFFAYDTPDDYEPLVEASKMLLQAGFTRHNMRCYVLCAFKKDTLQKAQKRMESVVKLGFFPDTMVYQDQKGLKDQNWSKFQKVWSRPAIINKMVS